MRRCSINDIKGGEILAEPIMTDDYRILLAEGTVLQKEYAEKIAELGVTEVCIQEEKQEEEKNKEEKKAFHAVKIETQNRIKNQVKNVLERHIYQENQELQKLSDTAENIIDDILQEEDIVEIMIEVKERNADLYEHTINCCALSVILGLRLGLEQDRLHAVGVGCLLHDIGLRFISVPYENIDIEEMSENQSQEYKKHSVYGYSSLDQETWLEDISKKIILSHHERLDGTGYPFHSRTIPTEIAIVSVCDAFDEMISGIGYRRVKTYKAVEYLKAFQNVKFDGKIVDEFLKIMAFYPVGSRVLLSTGENGIVIRQNKGFPERPVIRINLAENEAENNRTLVRNLLHENSIFIEEVIN